METKIFKTDEKNIIVEKNVYKGYGIAHVDSNTIFVEKAVEGDELKVKILYKKAKSLFAKPIKIIKKSKYRNNDIFCSAFYECGGCDWLNIKYSHQLEIKKRIIKELYDLKKIDIVESSYKYHYRNKNFLPVAMENNKPVIGIYKKGSHKVVPHKKCFLTPEIFDNLAQNFIDYLKKSNEKIYNEKNHSGNIRHFGIRINSQGKLLLTIVTKKRKLAFTNLMVKMFLNNYPNIIGIVQNINEKKTNKILGEEEKILYGKNYFFETILDKIFQVHYKAFFQVNMDIATKMFKFVLDNLNSNEDIVDAFCGTGTIGIIASDKVRKVYFIENNKEAIDNLKINIKINNLTNYKIIHGDVNQELIKISNIDTIIFDPPRKGIDRNTLQTVSKYVKKIIYVSCNPYSQKRDTDILLENNFAIKSIKVFDMFPQTYHIETVIILEKK